MSDELDPDEVPTIAGPDGPAGSHVDTPEFIGPYRLLKLLGEGGMGQVFAAEQKEPIRRKVALKIIKPGMDTKEVLARFEAERQAVALMDHTNIARVYDAGTTEDGRPYFVMELVEGKPLTEFCDEKKLPLKDRLELFRQVCHAVQHAHQKGIIHRDLKPSNILITTDSGKDDQPVPKIIDFGVAKALGPGLTEQTLFTMAGQIIGTPQYMSPEQAQFDASDIDTRSDIYSLGVLLYELLTGRTPVEMATLKKAGIDEMLRTIREEEAPKPSTRLHSLEDQTQTSIAEVRQLPPSKLTQTLRGDLDWIVMKALEKERSRRYETANAFASDIQRYLMNEPVEASPPSASYRFKKFAHRNRGAMTVASLITVTVVAAIIANLIFAHEARVASQRSDVARKDAEQLVAYMVGDLSERLEKIGKLDLMADVEAAIADYYGKTSELPDQRGPSRLEATALLKQSQTFRAQGHLSMAIESASAAAVIFEQLYRQNEITDLAEMADARRIESELLTMSVRWPEAGAIREATIERLKSAREERALTKGECGVLGQLLNDQALHVFHHDKDLDRARDLIRESLSVHLELVQDFPDWDEPLLWLARAKYAAHIPLGADLSSLGQAMVAQGTSGEILARLAMRNQNDYRMKAEIVRIISRTTITSNFLESFPILAEEGKALDPLTLAREIVEHDPTNLEWRQLYADTAKWYGSAFCRVSLALSRSHFETAIDHWSQLLDTELRTAAIVGIGGVRSEWGRALEIQDDPEAAKAEFRKGIELFNSILSNVPGNVDWSIQLAELHFRLAYVLDDEEPDEALPHLEEARSLIEPIVEKMPGASWANRTFMYTLKGFGAVELKRGNQEAAQEHYEAALAVARKFKDYDANWLERYTRTLRTTRQCAEQGNDLDRVYSLVKEEVPLYKALIEQATWQSTGELVEDYLQSLAALHIFSADRGVDLSEATLEAIQEVEGWKSSRGWSQPDRDLVQLWLAQLNFVVGRQNFSLGKVNEMAPFLEKASQLAWPLVEKGVLLDESQMIATLFSIGQNQFYLKEHGKCLEAFEWLLKAYEKAEPEEVASWYDDIRGRVAWAAERMGELHQQAGRLNEAERVFRKSLEVCRLPDVAWVSGISGDQLAARVKVRLANLYELTGREDDPQVEEWFREAHQTLSPLGGEETIPHGLVWAYDQATSYVDGTRVSEALMKIIRPADLSLLSDDTLRDQIAWLEREIGRSFEDPWLISKPLAERYFEQADRIDNGEQLAEAVSIFRQSAELSRAMVEGGKTEELTNLIRALFKLGYGNTVLRQRAEAHEAFRELVDACVDADPDDISSWLPTIRGRVAHAAESVAQFEERHRNWDKAESAYLEAIRFWELPDTKWISGATGLERAQMTRVFLAELYQKSERADEPEVMEWYRVAAANLSQIAEERPLHPTVEETFEKARSQVEAASPSEGGGDE